MDKILSRIKKLLPLPLTMQTLTAKCKQLWRWQNKRWKNITCRTPMLKRPMLKAIHHRMMIL